MAGVPHHVTQRGNRRQLIFLSRGDESAYLTLLRDCATRYNIETIAYCLMPNHVHLVVIPSCSAGLHLALKSAHGRYAQRINRIKNQTGHFWQGRYFSSPLDADYFLNAVRYVELNPVRAGLVKEAEDYRWSSAAFHCGLRSDPIVKAQAQTRLLAGITNWSRWLADGISGDSVVTLRRHGSQNLPCGSSQFIAALEQSAGRKLRYRSPGRQAEAKGDGHL